jgi:hypothetical protein
MRFNPPIATVAALVLALGAAPPAVANQHSKPSPPGSAGPCSEVCSGGAASYGTPVTPASNAGPFSEVCSGGAASYGAPSPNASLASIRPTVLRVITPKSGFDWGDAGIGAAGGFGLAMLALAGALAISQRRARRPSRSAPWPS